MAGPGSQGDTLPGSVLTPRRGVNLEIKSPATGTRETCSFFNEGGEIANRFIGTLRGLVCLTSCVGEFEVISLFIRRVPRRTVLGQKGVR